KEGYSETSTFESFFTWTSPGKPWSSSGRSRSRTMGRRRSETGGAWPGGCGCTSAGLTALPDVERRFGEAAFGNEGGSMHTEELSTPPRALEGIFRAAVGVLCDALQDRLKKLSAEDRADLLTLFRDLVAAESEEESESIVSAITEILVQR